MGKEKFLEIIKFASQPLPEGAEKSFDGDDYNERQILRHANQDSKAKLRGTYRPRTLQLAEKALDVVRRNAVFYKLLRNVSY